MAKKLIKLEQLQRFKSKADAKYQDKLTAGSNISISNNTISVFAAQSNPTYTELNLDTSYVTYDDTIRNIKTVTLMPGTYFLVYTCRFSANSTGYRQCGFSTSQTDITGFGRSWGDSRKANTNAYTYTRVSGVFNISASSYPNGQTFYLLARQNSGGALYVYPYCSYVKLA